MPFQMSGVASSEKNLPCAEREEKRGEGLCHDMRRKQLEQTYCPMHDDAINEKVCYETIFSQSYVQGDFKRFLQKPMHKISFPSNFKLHSRVEENVMQYTRSGHKNGAAP